MTMFETAARVKAGVARCFDLMQRFPKICRDWQVVYVHG
jgi:hypothetical protein